MFQDFSMSLAGMNQHVSGMAYVPLTPGLRAADVPLTLPLTLAHQEAARATKSRLQVISFTYPKMPVFRPEKRLLA